MRNNLILASLLAAVAAPSLAMAQPDPSCVRSNNQTSATGTVLGALGGALIGNAIAGKHNRGVGTVGGALAGGVAGNVLAGQHNDPCPDGYYRPQPANGPGYQQGPGPQGPGYGPPPPEGGFWGSAPHGIHERIDFVQERINRGASSGRLSPRESRMANRDLNDIRRQEMNLRNRDGGHLNPPDRDYLQQRLDTLSQRLHWAANNGY